MEAMEKVATKSVSMCCDGLALDEEDDLLYARERDAGAAATWLIFALLRGKSS
jgi:hypothetical protein